MTMAEQAAATVAGGIPSHEELVGRARVIAPTLVARQAETERRTFYAPDTDEAFREAGFYRMLVPRRYGGYEVGMETFMEVIVSIARGCPSTAWQLALGIQHAVVVATAWSERAQDELFAAGDFVSPGTTAPTGTIERAGDGGWIVDGTWAFCSGAPYASHLMAHAIPAESTGLPRVPTLFVVPSAQWTRLDDWGTQLGMRGSGSHSIRIDRAHIPAHYALPGVGLLGIDVRHGTPGLELHGNPLYASPTPSLLAMQWAAISVGIVLGAMDEYRHIANTKTSLRPPPRPRKDVPEHQRWYGTALGRISVAHAALRGLAAEWTAHAHAGDLPDHDARFVTMISEIHELCWDALDRSIFRTAGSTSIRAGERMERLWRDMTTLRTHTGTVFLIDTAQTQAGQTALGSTP